MKDDNEIEYDNVSLIAESDIEKNFADEEFESDPEDYSDNDDYKVPEWINNSFTGPYSNIDDIHLDKGRT